MIRMGKLNVPEHRDVAKRALKHAEWRHGYRDHNWGDDWAPSVQFYTESLRYPVSDARGMAMYEGWQADDWTFARFFVTLLLRGWDIWNEVHHYGPGTADHLGLSPRIGEGFYLRAAGDLIYGGTAGVEVILTAVRKCQLPDLTNPAVRHQSTSDVAHLIHLARKQHGFDGDDWYEAGVWLDMCAKAKARHNGATRPAGQEAGGGTTQAAARDQTVWEAAGYGVPMEQEFLDVVAETLLSSASWSLPLLRRRACA